MDGGCSTYGRDEPSGAIKGGEFLDWLSDLAFQKDSGVGYAQ
jgi:hypothetical protein